MTIYDAKNPRYVAHLLYAADQYGGYSGEFRATPPSSDERRGVRKLRFTCPIPDEQLRYHDIVYDSDDVTIVRSRFAIERCVYCPTCRSDVVVSHTPMK